MVICASSDCVTSITVCAGPPSSGRRAPHNRSSTAASRPSALRIVRSSIAATASIIPTVIVSDRWYDSVFFGIDRPEGLPASQQERAYTSPIWYTPE
ncbi:MAG: DUF3604 domain-containing protein [Rhodobacteraceae bacterium]|nr:DUF3604 domain-containing protein [Paracoccaceae bacterium]MBL4556848.1 DUF3604 domain-containing protein [Paracoccaceae bacterium]HBG99412.1 hypothetical protein [Paracoccaceae bacterium]